jgi:hypothetical protein
MFDSRLGAAFSISLPFVFAALFVFVFGATKAINTKTLKPSSSIDMTTAQNRGVDYESTRTSSALVGVVQIEINTFAPSETGAICQSIGMSARLEKQAFDCDMLTDQSTNIGTEIDGYLFCRTVITCEVSIAFVAKQQVMVEFPDPFQTFNWTVTPDIWSDTPGENVALGHAFNERGAYGAREDEEISSIVNNSFGLQLAGTRVHPTTVSFKATRSVYKEIFQNQKSVGKNKDTINHNFEQWGVQLSYQGVVPEFETNLGTALGHHVVSFSFDVEDPIYVNQWESFADPMTAVGTAGAFLLSALALMRGAKMFLGHGIDLLLLRRANGSTSINIPSDVAIRRATLVENRKEEIDKAHAVILSREESSAASGGGGDGDVEIVLGINPMNDSTVSKLEKKVIALERLVQELVSERR